MVVTLSSSDQYFGSRRLAVLDQLGSVGTYFPWGENRGSTNPQNTWSFATYWADSVSGLDYANNRYYTSALARFMTPDPAGQAAATPQDPVSWNRYAYTGGDPVNRYDPSGLVYYGSYYDCVADNEANGSYAACVINDDGDGFQSNTGSCQVGDASCNPNPCFSPDGTPSPGPFCQIGGQPVGTTPPPPPECEVELLSQFIQPAGYSTPFIHTSTELLMEYGGVLTTLYINGVPKNGQLTLVYSFTPYYPSPVTVVWSSGFSTANCALYSNILVAASTFPNGKYAYGVIEQNSNSLTHSLLVTMTNVLPWYVNLYEAESALTLGWLWPLKW